MTMDKMTKIKKNTKNIYLYTLFHCRNLLLRINGHILSTSDFKIECSLEFLVRIYIKLAKENNA